MVINAISHLKTKDVMKVKIFSVLVVVFLGTYSVNGQVDFFNNSEETARRLDSMEGRDTPQRRENRENNRNSDDSDRNNELRERWEGFFEDNMGPLKEGMDKFDTPETRCIFIMVNYLYTYLQVVESTNNAIDCKTKSDGYALQSIAIAAGSSFMYCPESLSKLTEEEKNRIWSDDLKPILVNEDNNLLIKEWENKLELITLDYGEGSNHINTLLSYFIPSYIINRLLIIQQNIEELNCPD